MSASLARRAARAARRRRGGLRRWSWAAVLLSIAVPASVLGFSSTAGAQPAPPADTVTDAETEARARFEKARAFAEKQEWEAALAEFLQSRKLYPTWGNTLGVASTLRRLKRLDEALAMFEVLLRDHSDRLPAATRTAARTAVAEIRDQVGTIEIQGAEPDSTVTVDGRIRGEYPLLDALRVPAGTHVVRLYKEGFEPFEARVDVPGGQTIRVPVRLLSLGKSGRLRVAEQGNRTLDVIVDGNAVGKTPWEGRLSPGQHTVSLRGEGEVGTQPASVVVQTDQVARLTLAAEELSASLHVEPTPMNASVAIDSVALGGGIWEGRLRAGEHTIEVAAPGFLPGTERITLKKGDERQIAIVLTRDPGSPFWKKPPRPARFAVELEGSGLIVPSVGGDISGGCAGECSAPPGTGFHALARFGYELSSGVGFGTMLGYVFASQTVSGHAAQMRPVGSESIAQGTTEDTIALRRGLMAGLWGGYSLGERVRAHARLGAGVLLGSVATTRTGTFAPTRPGPDYSIGPITLSYDVPFFVIAPDLRVGLPIGDHLEISAGVSALVLVASRTPAWDDRHEVAAGVDGIGTLPPEKLIGLTMLMIAPGLGVRYDF